MCKKLRTKGKEFKKTDCLRLAYLEEMNFTMVIQFMQNSGFAFSPVTKNDLDLGIFMYIYKYNGFSKGQEHFEKNIVNISEYGTYIIDVIVNDLM